MPVKISPIEPEDIPGAARCIQRAFRDDPYFKWVFDVTSVGTPMVLYTHQCIYLCPRKISKQNSITQSAICPL
jgi:hypothetical protein